MDILSQVLTTLLRIKRLCEHHNRAGVSQAVLLQSIYQIAEQQRLDVEYFLSMQRLKANDNAQQNNHE
jgi:hypothetical protein